MRWLFGLRAVVVLGACWYASLAVHEAGHALAGLIVGAETIDVDVPLIGFSQTAMTGNEHPAFTTASGLVVGALVPVACWLLIAWRVLPGRGLVQFWAGFGLVFNGAYLAGDALARGGDGGVLVREGAPVWLLVMLGLGGVAAGLWVWHLLGVRPPGHRAGPDAQRTS